jgi:hypothetical protein
MLSLSIMVMAIHSLLFIIRHASLVTVEIIGCAIIFRRKAGIQAICPGFMRST